MSNKTTPIKDLTPVIFNNFGFGFVEVDGLEVLVIGVGTFIKFFTSDCVRDFLHEWDSLDLIFFFDGIDFLLHFFVHVGLLFFDVVDAGP